jgi:Leucine-rich repeat (LRR) protein
MPIPESIKAALETNNFKDTQLKIRNWGLDDKDVEELANLLAALPNNPINEIDLESNNIRDSWAEILAQIPGLQKLFLGYNKIKDNGAVALSKLRSLKVLDLKYNGLSDIGALAIIKGDHFEKFNLEDNAKVSKFLRRIKLHDPEIEKTIKNAESRSAEQSQDIDMLFNTHRTAVLPGLDEIYSSVPQIRIEKSPKPN